MMKARDNFMQLVSIASSCDFTLKSN